jgi:ABC-type antimicrobial peptide transport system permease subunit
LRAVFSGYSHSGFAIVLAGAVLLFLVIACANVANLLLARGSTREPEMAVRRALGAGRVRLLQQLITESIVIAMAAGLAGSALAWGSAAVLEKCLPSLPRIQFDADAESGLGVGSEFDTRIVKTLRSLHQQRRVGQRSQ